MLESEVEEYDSDGDLMYRPRVRYTYRVNGREYIGDAAYRMGYSTNSRREIERFVQERPAGKLVEVYYDAKQPERSFLVDNVRTAFLVGVLIFVVLSVYVILSVSMGFGSPG